MSQYPNQQSSQPMRSGLMGEIEGGNPMINESLSALDLDTLGRNAQSQMAEIGGASSNVTRNIRAAATNEDSARRIRNARWKNYALDAALGFGAVVLLFGGIKIYRMIVPENHNSVMMPRPEKGVA